jgi:dihydrolipoamide dehydrogenase
LDAEITIIGGGPGGYTAAIYAAHLGAKVVLVEKDKLGGTCLNRGCIPTKALTSSVEVFEQAKRAADFGLEIGNVKASFAKIMARKDRIVSQLTAGVNELMRLNKITVVRAAGRIVSPTQVQAGIEIIESKTIIIATGSEPARLPILGSDTAGVLDTDAILSLTELPESLVIVGGSYVGCEFAGIMSALGTKVTIIEALPRILSTVDEDIVRFFNLTLRKRGIEVKTGAMVKAIRRERDLLRVSWDAAGGEQSAAGQYVLMAIGRTPYTDNLGVGELGMKMNKRAIAVNDCLETSVPGIYAVGDVTGKTMLAHYAYYQGEIAVENALGGSRKADNTVVPACIFVQPEIASVGMTEKQTKDAGIAYDVSRFPFAANGRAVTMDEAVGTVKMICGIGGKVLGVQIAGPQASNIIAEAALAIAMGATAMDIARTIHTHPTLPEVLHEAAMGHLSGAIHIKRF